jgi:flagellar protein FlbD
MIEVTRLDHAKIWLNAELIESLQATPDTVITLTNRARMMVRESVEEVSERIRNYQRAIHTYPALHDTGETERVAASAH